MTVPGYRNVPAPAWDPAAPVDPAEAEDFLRQCYAEHPRLGPVAARLAVVRAQIAATGAYAHTPDELAYGAKLAWRNSSRCIGRLYWRSLTVLDRRRARTADEIFALTVRHLQIANGLIGPGGPPPSGARRARQRGPSGVGRPASDGGDRPARDGASRPARDGGGQPARDGGGQPACPAGEPRAVGAIRPVISIFAPAAPGQPHARIWNEQLIRYAGYRTECGGLIGDPRYLEFTAAMRALGWRAKGEAFDVLPLVIETPADGVRLYELPEQAVLEVPLAHPDHPWFAELGLRWHAVPAIANMRLSIGGVNYPLAPFNGWYMGTEIGVRNLADPDRYDMLPVVARMLRLDTSSESTLWRDRALVELNRAVLWSFQRAGVKITDHHTESERFLAHLRNEGRAGREVPADWSWIVPPMSGAVTGVFHRYYHEAHLRPNFYLDEQACLLGRSGGSAPANWWAGFARDSPDRQPDAAGLTGSRTRLA